MKIVRVLSLSLVLSSLSIFFAAHAVEEIKVPKDSRLRADEQAGLFWIDEDNVLFQSFRTEDLDRMDKKTFQSADIYRVPRQLRIRNVRTEEIKDYALSDQSSGLCFSSGNILYKRPAEPGALPSYVFGPLGKEKASSLTKDVETFGINSFIRCSNADVSQFPPFPSIVVPLLEEHGFVEIRMYQKPGQPLTHSDAELYLYKKGEAKPSRIEGYTPQMAYNLLNRAPDYATWKGAYFNYTVGVRSAVPNYAWWLFPDGRTEKLAVPRGPWNEFTRTNASFIPTRVGLLIWTWRPREKSELVLMRGNLEARAPSLSRPERIYSGLLWRMAISPQGCRLALVEGATQIPNTEPSGLRFLDLCKA